MKLRRDLGYFEDSSSFEEQENPFETEIRDRSSGDSDVEYSEEELQAGETASYLPETTTGAGIRRRNLSDQESQERTSKNLVNEFSSPSIKSEMPFLSDTSKRKDFEALKEGLTYALGSSTSEANWFPTTENEDLTTRLLGSSKEDVTDHDDRDINETYLDNIPLQDLKTPDSESRMNPFEDIQDERLTLHPSRSFNSARDNNLEASEDHQSSHRLSPHSPTHSKLSVAIARISDRIAGARPLMSPALEQLAENSLNPDITPSVRLSANSSTNWDNDDGSNISHTTIPEVRVTDSTQEPSKPIGLDRTSGLGIYINEEVAARGSSSPKRKPISENDFRPVDASFFDDISSRPSKFQKSDTAYYTVKERNNFKDNVTMYLFGKSLKIFTLESKIRQSCYKVVSHRWLSLILLAFLFLQVILLSYRLWNPMKLGGYYYSGNNWADYILIFINIFYTFEIICAIIAYGFYDDRVMFDELNIPYPENEIGQKFNIPFYSKLLKSLRLLKSLPPAYKKASASKPLSSSKKLNMESNNNSIIKFDSNDNGFTQHTDIRKKYSDSDSQTSREDNSKDLDLEDEPVMTEQRLRMKSTLLKPQKIYDRIDDLHLKRAYIRSSWHRIDFLSAVFFWISILLSIDQYDRKHHVMLFRALSCLRILRLCNLTTGTSTILMACRVSIPQLIDVSMFIGFFWIFFAIIGVQSFKSSFTRHCVWYNPEDVNDTYENTSQYCGSFIDLDGKSQPYIRRDGSYADLKKGFTCPRYSKCESRENPYDGTVSFDNVIHSMELVFVVMSANTFTDIMYDTMDSDNLVACLYFIVCIFIMTVWLINVFVAVIVASFKVIRVEAFEGREGSQDNRLWKMFGSSNKEVSLHQHRIEKLKKQNKFLKFYYTIEIIFPIIIMVDLFVMCFRTYDMSDSRARILKKFELATTIILLVESICRFLFYFPNWRLYFYSKRNIFDLFLAIITFVIVIEPIRQKLGHAYDWLTVFQILRFYRVVLATKVTRGLWLKINSNFRALFDLALFFFILTFLSSIIMTRYFEGTFSEDDLDFSEVPLPMHTLPNAFVALYVITSTENWTEILYAMQEYGSTISLKAFGAIFLIGWFIISNMVVLNIFIAVIANTLEVSEDEKRKKQLYQFIDNMTRRLQSQESESSLLSKIKIRLFGKQGVRDELEQTVVNLLLSGTAVNDFLDVDNVRSKNESNFDLKDLPRNSWKRWLHINYWRTANYLRNPFYGKSKQASINFANFDPATFAKDVIAEKNKIINDQNNFLKKNPKYNYVFYFMGPRHRLRTLCQRIVSSNHGERIDGVEPNKILSEAFVVIMFAATITLVVTACYVTPLYMYKIRDPEGRNNWSFYLEVGFICLFSFEFVVKVIADGLLFTPNAYMRSSWNIIEMIVLVSLWIEFIALLKLDHNLARIFRAIKALRALRLLTISRTAKNNFQHTIISGFWKIISAAMISLCLLFPFSIWGLNIFNGRLGYCLDGVSNKTECNNEYKNEVFDWEVLSPNIYTNPPLEFNRFTTSFSSLFQIISLEGWLDLLIDVMNSTGIGTPQGYFASPFNGFFVVLFNFVSTIFILTTFVSVIISNYSKTTGRAYMTIDQIAWYQVRKYLSQVMPSKRKNLKDLKPFRRFCYRMTVERNSYWRAILNVVLFVTVVALLIECFPTPDWLYVFRYVLYTITSCIFFINASMQLIGQGTRTFFGNKWNGFNFFVSIGAFATTIIAFFLSPENTFLNFNKLFLLATLLFIIPRSNRLSELLRFASASLPSLISLSFTWIVMFLVYAIAMNQIFGTTKIGPNTSGNINVRSVPKALILLFRCSFGEGWNYIMDDFKLTPPFCTDNGNLTNDCGNVQYAYILFMLWNVISMYIFLNMFVSLILDSFSYINHRALCSHLIKREEIRKFKRIWQLFDPEGTGFIKPYYLPKLLHTLDGALSFHLYSGPLEIRLLCKKWIRRNDPRDPYNITVNHEAIEKTLLQMDISKIRTRRFQYERFIEEALLTMELNGDPGISFRRILLQIPLYNSFEPGECLNLIDFLDRRLLMQKVDKRLHKKRVYETIAAYACRWKYLENKKRGLRRSDIDFGKELRRKSYLQNEDLEVSTPLNSKPNMFESNEDSSSLSDNDRNSDANWKIQENLKSVNEPNTNSGMYVPKSPINVFNSRFKKNEYGKNSKTNLPKLRVEVPSVEVNLPAGSEESSEEKDTTNQMSPLPASPLLSKDKEDSPQDPFSDFSLVSATLENSEWAQVLRDVKKDAKKE